MVCLNQFLYPVTDTALNIDRLMEITKAFLNNLQYSKTVGQHLKVRLPRPVGFQPSKSAQIDA